MDALSQLIDLSAREKRSRGLVHTPAEIAQQPDTWLSTFELFSSRRTEIEDFLGVAGVAKNSDNKPIVFLIGAGTSDYIGCCLTYLLRSCWQCEVVAVPSTDLLTHTAQWLIPRRRYLWISFSRSGDSPEGVAVLQLAREKYPDIHHLVVSCNANGRMIRESAGAARTLIFCLDDKVNDRGLAMTSSFSNMLIFGQCLAHINDLPEYREVLLQLAQEGRKFLPLAADIASALATGSYSKACFVGSGPLRGVAKESALKLLEMTAGKTQTMSESVMGLRHGPMAALDEDTLFVCFLSGDSLIQRYERDLVQEIATKRIVKTCLVVGAASDSDYVGLAEYILRYSARAAVTDDYRPVIDVMFGQVLGLFFSMEWNLQPDCPSPNGVISRVVQNVSIHS